MHSVPGSLNHFAVTADGRFVASIAEYDSGRGAALIKVWDRTSGTRKEFPVTGARRVAIVPDGTRLAVGLDNGEIRMIRTSDGGSEWAGKMAPVRVDFLQVSADGRFLLSSSDEIPEDKLIRAWDAQTGREVARLEGKDAVAFSSGSRLAITGGRSNITDDDEPTSVLFRLWSVPNFKEFKVGPQRGGRLKSAVFSPDGRRVLLTNDQAVEIFDVTSLTSRTVHDMTQSGFDDAVFSTDGRRVASLSDKTVSIWDAETGDLLLRMKPDGLPQALAWTSNELFVYTPPLGLTIFDGSPIEEQ